VRELKKRQQKQLERERRLREKTLERERQEREMQAKLKMEQDAYEMRVAALAPKVEAMEMSWNRIRTISGADTPDDVIAYWEGESGRTCAAGRLLLGRSPHLTPRASCTHLRLESLARSKSPRNSPTRLHGAKVVAGAWANAQNTHFAGRTRAVRAPASSHTAYRQA
jgi:hypothetical protein